MRGARFLSAVVLSALLGVCAGRDALIAAAAAESSGDWRITKEIDSVTGAKILHMKIEARKTPMTVCSFRPTRCCNSAA